MLKKASIRKKTLVSPRTKSPVGSSLVKSRKFITLLILMTLLCGTAYASIEKSLSQAKSEETIGDLQQTGSNETINFQETAIPSEETAASNEIPGKSQGIELAQADEETSDSDTESTDQETPDTEISTFDGTGSSLSEAGLSNVQIIPLANTGSAGTNIPIAVPPGRKGIAPMLSLNYSSSSRNGWIGVGWSLDMGAIQRSTKRSLDYSSNDYVATANGSSSELVPRGDWGTNYYGAKLEGAFSKYYYNTATGGWEVTTKDGGKYYYGTTSASRQNNANGTFKWCLDRVEDTNGNYMTITYWKNQGQIYLDRIDYTGNTSGLSPTNYVKFYRETRGDAPDMYTTNSSVRTALPPV